MWKSLANLCILSLLVLYHRERCCADSFVFPSTAPSFQLLSLSLTSSPLTPTSPLSSSTSSSSIQRRIVPSSTEIEILDSIGNGTFGGVYHARNLITKQALIAKSARATTQDERATENAISYLEIEAYINSKLCPPPAQQQTNNTPTTNHYNTQHHVAPYIGEYTTVNGTTYLLWETSGNNTLEDYIAMEDDGWIQLAIDLGLIDETDESVLESSDRQKQQVHNQLAAEVLRQILEGLAYCHSCGIVHRDIKPANILVDPTTHTLRLIDFGSACCMNSWGTNKLGYKGENKGPRSILYCAPEEFVNEEHPYAFDLYGVAITWIRTVLSEDGHEDEDRSNHLGLGNESELFKWRIDVRNFGHNLVAWEEYAVLHNTLPYGWDSLFGSSRRGIHALRLLSNMMSYSPGDRISAAEALVGSYLNPSCDAEPPPELPPAMPFSIMSHIQRWKADKEVHEECQLEDLFTKVVAVELELPLEISLGPRRGNIGVKVTGVADTTSSELHEGDSLLAIGSIDVENVSLEHVEDLLQQWPAEKPVSMLLVRDAD